MDGIYCGRSCRTIGDRDLYMILSEDEKLSRGLWLPRIRQLNLSYASTIVHYHILKWLKANTQVEWEDKRKVYFEKTEQNLNKSSLHREFPFKRGSRENNHNGP